MPKILVIAIAEIRALLRTKAFLVSMLLVPALGFGFAQLTKRLSNADSKTRAFAVIDHAPPEASLYLAIERAAAERDREIAAGTSKDGNARFVPSRIDVSAGSTTASSLDEVRLRASDAVRRGELFAFVELPADLADGGTGRAAYFSDAHTYFTLRAWLDQTLTKEVRARRYRASGLGPEAVAALERGVTTDNRGLFQAGANGEVHAAESIDKVRIVLAPMAALVLMMMLALVTGPQLLQAVIEEKSSRISEVLLGSVAPFELMMGKLLAGVFLALALGGVYIGGLLRVAASFGFSGLVSPGILAWFFVYLFLSMLLYGSLYLAIGAACSDAKGAQSLMTPVMLVKMLPLFIARNIIESPGEPLAVGASLFPLTAPSLMMARLTLRPAPPAWQVGLSIILTLITALTCVWAASRIFRIGLLAQGKTPSVAQLVRWVFARS